MRNELEQKLKDEFPKLYEHLDDFEHCDGWFDIIHKLSKQLEEHPEVRATQVKEKFGTLRFYCDGYDEISRQKIMDAEVESSITCEICGAWGKLRKGGWVRTLCDEHTTYKPKHYWTKQGNIPEWTNGGDCKSPGDSLR